jgi:hypothetical protein
MGGKKNFSKKMGIYSSGKGKKEKKEFLPTSTKLN